VRVLRKPIYGSDEVSFVNQLVFEFFLNRRKRNEGRAFVQVLNSWSTTGYFPNSTQIK
jgi:hypothetical protein